MNLSLNKRPRIRAAIAAASFAVLATSLTACGGSEAANTTCGEVNGMSDDELTDLAKSAADSELSDDEKKQIEDLGDSGYQLYGQSIKLLCNGQPDDKKLGDIDEDDVNIDPSDIPSDFFSDVPTDAPS